ncbi:hypothetical protein ACQKO6_18010 [Pseudomonas monteilii]
MDNQTTPSAPEEESRLAQLVRLAVDALLDHPRAKVPGDPGMTMRQLSMALQREALPAIEELEALRESVLSIGDLSVDQEWAKVSVGGALGSTLERYIQDLQTELARSRLNLDPDTPLRTYGQEPLSHIKELANEVQDVTGVVCGGHPRKVGALLLLAAAVPDLVGHIEEIEFARVQ